MIRTILLLTSLTLPCSALAQTAAEGTSAQPKATPEQAANTPSEAPPPPGDGVTSGDGVTPGDGADKPGVTPAVGDEAKDNKTSNEAKDAKAKDDAAKAGQAGQADQAENNKASNVSATEGQNANHVDTDGDVQVENTAEVEDAVPVTTVTGLDTVGTVKVVFASIWSPTEVFGPGVEPGSLAPVLAEIPIGTHAVTFSAKGGKPMTIWITVLAPAESETETETQPEPGRVLVDPSTGRIVSTAGGLYADLARSMAATPGGTEAAGAKKSGAICKKGRPCMTAGNLAVWPLARLRAGFELQQPDSATLFIGNNDGFYLQQARLGFGGAYKDLVDFRLTFDGASFFPDRVPNKPVQPLTTAVVDAYLKYTPLEYVNVWAGQVFMPADFEGSRSRAVMTFTDRSVASGGVRAGRGYEVAGLSPGREIGLVVGATDARIGPVSLDYLAAISNGNGNGVLGNDNKLPAAHFRLGVGWERFAVLGLGGSFNPRTTGELPNLYNETDLQGFVDFKLDFYGFNILAQAIARQTTFDSVFPDVTDPNRTAFGYGATGWIVIDEPFGLPMFGIKPGYRVSFYDPTTSFSDDQLLEHTLGIRYDPKTYDLPIALLLDVTMLMEIDAAGLRPLDNNRIVAMVQFDL